MKNKKLFAILTLVCFMFTLMPMAAFAAGEVIIADSMSVAWTDDKKVDVRTEAAEFNLSIRDVNGLQATTDSLYVWVTKDGSSVPVNTVVVDGQPAGQLVYNIGDAATGEKEFDVVFNATGNFVVHVSSIAPVITSGAISNASEFNYAGNKVEVVTDADDTRDYYIVTNVNGTVSDEDGVATGENKLKDGYTESSLRIDANNVDEKEVTITLFNGRDAAKAGVKVDIDVAGAISVDKDSVYTNVLGQAKFKVAGSRDGVYKIYLSAGKYESVIEVVVGAIGANTIVGEGETAPYDIIGETTFGGVIEFDMYDVNGNKVVPDPTRPEGWEKALNSDNDDYDYNGDGDGIDATGYVAIVEQPADSDLENEDLIFDGETVVLASGKIEAEGKYTFKVVLDNGAYATASCVVKAFDVPVKLIIACVDNMELGSTIGVATRWIDANGVVETDTKGVEVVATGYAVKSFVGESLLSAKSDEKYEGSVITLTAVDERYNLVATKEVTIAKAAQELKFTETTAEVNVNNYIDINVVDEDGRVVSLSQYVVTDAGGDFTDANAVDISYVILDKPEGANVFVTTYEQDNILKKGVFTMNLTSNKVGVVKVQAVVKYVYEDVETQADVVKYYTGVQEIAVGMDTFKDVVVMSIGSKEIVINSDIKEMLCEAVIKDSRTFVPFRAGLEALGATVDYDQATQSVIAEMNGVKVVMTIGEKAYTVNGVAKVADVAPYLNVAASTTMVPASFVAAAFGINVDYTTNPDGTVADVLFTNGK